MQKRAYLNHLKDTINKCTEKYIYFVIKLELNENKIVKISKQKDKFIKFLDSIPDNELYYYVVYSLPIYKKNFCYVGTNSVIGFKSIATQVLQLTNNHKEECV